MRCPPLAAARLGGTRSVAVRALAGAAAAVLLAACGTSPSSMPPIPSTAAISAGPAGSSAPSPTAAAVVTPQPTPRFTNEPDRELARLIPERAGNARVVVPPVDQFGYTPGDIAEAFGELGLRFISLQVAYVSEPRLSLFAMRVAPPEVRTEELEPYLETAGRYVGIAGLVREPWDLKTIGGRVVWVRPEDNATALGTHIYTWAAGEFVFLLIGVDEDVDRALFRALPGEPAPTPTPRPSRTPGASGSASPSAGASASADSS